MYYKSMKYRALLTLLFVPLLAFANSELAQLNPMKAHGFFISKKIVPGQLSDLQIELQLQDDFYAYHDRFQLKVIEPESVKVGEIFIDPIVDFDDSVSKKKKRGVYQKATLTAQIEIPSSLTPETSSMKMELTYIACTKKFCLTPRTIPLDIDISGLVLEKASEKSFLPNDSTAFIQNQIDNNLAYALILIFIFGVLTSLTPCIYPLIPITLAILGTEDKRSQWMSFLISLSYVFGIAMTYALLGVIAAQTGQLFGSFISHPAVIITMSLIFFAMGLSLLGFFELQAPAFIRNRLGTSKNKKGILGAFVSGLFAGVIASPCVGPVLVGILAYIAKTQNSALGFILLFTFALGFGLLFIALGTFSHLSQKLPRSGAWMNFIKTLLALCLFALSFYYSWPLIKKALPQDQTAISKEQGVQWKSFSTALVKAAENNQPVIIDFYADWCLSCVEMDELTFSKPTIIELSQKFLMLKVDATSPFPELTEWQNTYNVYGLPTMIFINKKGDVMEELTLTGFEEAELFEVRMNQALKD